MASFLVGCHACSTLLVLADANGPDRARRSGWMLSPLGWRCPKHTEPLAGELNAEPAPKEEPRTALPADISDGHA